jgi:hypothetical protein
MAASAKDREILRTLAKEVAEIAALPVQQERTRLWKDFNALRPRRPMVLAFPENGWKELVGEKDLRCVGETARKWEGSLLMRIFHARHIDDDQPITIFFNVAPAVHSTGFGVDTKYEHPDLAGGSYHWDPPIKSPSDLHRLHFNTITPDAAATKQRMELAQELFGDILRVRLHAQFWWTRGLTQQLVLLRGLDQVMYDLYDEPQLLHDLMTFLRDNAQQEIDTLESSGLLYLNNSPDDHVGSGGIGFTDELPAKDFAGRVRPGDMWVLGESQEFVGVGPEQFQEFVLQYQMPVLNRFGLVCYGCCEGLDRKFDLIKQHLPKLRRVSVSPWCDREIAAEKLSNRYIYSWKPNPALVCAPVVDWNAVEEDIRRTLRIARGGCVEMILKDTHTFCNEPARITRWVQTARKMIEEPA